MLKDIKRQIFVTLHYAIDRGEWNPGAIGDDREPRSPAVTIEQAAAAAWALPSAHYTLNYLTGRWAGEWT